MRGHRVIHVRAPLAGVQKRSSFQQTEPFFAYDALNVLPVDFKTGVSRDRIAVRPGFKAVTAAGSGSINMQATLHLAPGASFVRQPMYGRGGTLYRWNGSSFTSVDASAVDTGRPVCAISYLQKLYILNVTLAYKVYTFSGHSVGSWSGSPPADCPIGCVWDDRIVLSGNASNPHVVYFSRQGEGGPEDWVEDVDAPAPIISTSIEGGNISEPVTALVPHHRQCLLVGHWNSWDVYRGNPRRGGTLSRIPSPAGPICWTAWCYTSDGWLYYLSRDGLYRMPPGCGDVPQSVSRERLPEDLLAIDGIDELAYLEYDVRYRCVYIVVPGRQSYLYDLEKEGFWPITLADDDVESLHRHEQFETEDASGVYVGAAGLHRLDRTEPLEDGAEAYCQIGPIKLSDNMDEGATIYEVNAHFGKNTDDETGTLSVSCGLDAEEAIEQNADQTSSETFENILANNNRMLPHMSGHAAFIDLELGDENTHFSCERIDLHTRQYGKDR